MSDNKLISTIERSSTEQLQIAVKEYKGKKYLDLRIFYTTDDGASWLPTKKGVTVSPNHLSVLKEAIEVAIGELDGLGDE
ncbi:MAG: transcriptional coactivator p15/PC4 family protein [Candidatus Melainabacteria bacterium]|nr:MAG: transcriptional coactivator p15/PC4 family protein [Candidatus Melainabacteria bacterium]